MEKVATQPAFEEFTPIKLQAPPSRLESLEGFPFEFELGRRMVHELRSSTEGFGDPRTQINTPKSMEEVVTKVMKVNTVTKLFQTIAIVSLNMGNLTLEVNTMKNKLGMGEKENVGL
jgi:hypothetical protein